jgi:hypothetical protein
VSKFKIGDRIKNIDYGTKGTIAYITKNGWFVIEYDNGSSDISQNKELIKLVIKNKVTETTIPLRDTVKPVGTPYFLDCPCGNHFCISVINGSGSVTMSASKGAKVRMVET